MHFGSLIVAAHSIPLTKMIVGAYYASWAAYGRCTPAQIQPALTTLLIYAFANVNNDGIVSPGDSEADITMGGLQNLAALKSKNGNLKTLISIGGASVSSQTFSKIAANPTLRKAFANSANNFIKQYNFDGVDIDWEYPTQGGGSAQDKANFVALLKDFRSVLGSNRLLTVAVAAGQYLVSTCYDVKGITSVVDYINVMTYDMHSYTDGVTGVNSPLYSSDNNNVEDCINNWISQGANAKNILMGIGAYGKTFTLSNPSQNGIQAKVSGAGNAGPLTQSAGTLSYTEICQVLNNGWSRKYDDSQQTPYVFNGNQWIGYDDPQSLQQKISFAKKHNLGGYVVWSIDMDNCQGTCNDPFPLVNTLKRGL